MGAGGGSYQTYSPVYERAEDPTLAEEFLPTDTQTQNKIFRNIIMYDPVAGPATETTEATRSISCKRSAAVTAQPQSTNSPPAPACHRIANCRQFRHVAPARSRPRGPTIE